MLDKSLTSSASVKILTRSDVASLMRPADYLHAVEKAFRASKEGRAHAPFPMHIDGIGGAFHAKGGSFRNGRAYVALKLNGNFPCNPSRNGLPTIQGAIILCDAENGSLLAILDSIEITLRRTAASSALAAQYLARKDASVLCICGCGAQGRVQAEALAEVRNLKCGFAWDADFEKAKSFAREMTGRLGIEFAAEEQLGKATRQSDLIVTATTAKEPFLSRGEVSPGAFVAAVGADNPEKNEIAPDLMAAVDVVADVVEQCVEMGDLRAAIDAGVMTAGDVYADLGDIVAERKPGRKHDNQIFVFDSTGTALQDVTSAAVAYERAMEEGAGLTVALGA
jgi:alanine dehydrogenase